MGYSHEPGKPCRATTDRIGSNLVARLGFHQGWQMVYFKIKRPNLGIFWRALKWKMLAYFTAVCYHS
jgi:hypothetical protein